MNFREALKPELTCMEFLNIPHNERFEMIVKALGYEAVKRCIPFTVEQLKATYKNNEQFNNLSLREWDLAAGFTTGWQGKCNLVRSRLTNLYWEKCKVDTFSCADGVCILKCCARMWVEEDENGTE